MIFTSYTYIYFLLLMLTLFHLAPRSWRKPALIAASYVFYCSWRWEFGFLLLGVSVFNWAWGRWVLPRATSSGPLALGIGINLLPLVYFKYTGFILSTVETLARTLGAELALPELAVLLPLGISFFTFQGIAYLVDVAAGDEPFQRLADFVFYKAFWPQLVAGPIIRPSEIRAQIETFPPVSGEDFSFGGRRIVQGLFKKVVLADTIAPYVDLAFAAQATPNLVDVLTAVAGFGLQIYFDFSAYSDIAIGSARLFGFRFPENFDWPYAARSPQEFWQRWHMTLSRWIRDYVFAPLSFASRHRPRLGLAWLLLAMAGCGLWHGAQWTFVLWGVWHGLLLVLNQTALRALFPAPGSPGQWGLRQVGAFALTQLLVTAGWLLFRAGSLAQVGVFLEALFTLKGGLRPAVIRENGILIIALLWVACTLAHLLSARIEELRARSAALPGIGVAEPILYTTLILLTIISDHEAQVFVYFQF